MTGGSSLTIRAYAATLLGVFGHATSEFFAVLSGIGGPEVSVWRYLIGSLSLFLVALALPSTRNLWRPLKEQPVKIISLAVFGMALGQLLFHWSLDFASVIQVATVITTMPIMTVMADALINRNRITVPKLISGIGALGGVIFLLTDGYLAQLELGSDDLNGIFMAIACSVIGGFYVVLVKPVIVEYGAIRITALTFILGTVALWLTVGSAWNIWVNPLTLFDREPVAYYSILTLGIWNTCVGFILWLWGLSAAPDTARASYLFFLKPVIAAVCALVFLGSNITWIQTLAIAVICGCVLAEVLYGQFRDSK